MPEIGQVDSTTYERHKKKALSPFAIIRWIGEVYGSAFGHVGIVKEKSVRLDTLTVAHTHT